MVDFATLWKEASQGKTVGRILFNEGLEGWRHELKGQVLDLGCGSNPSYRRVMQLVGNNGVTLVGIDLNPRHRPTIVGDLERPLPLKDQTADAAIISSFLYISADPENLLREVRRVLRPQGKLIITSPMVFPYTPEPKDHWRFTEEALRLILSRAGFSQLEIVPLGGRWTCAAYLLSAFLRPRFLVAPLVYWFCLQMDRLTGKLFPHLPQCPLGHIVKGVASP